MLTPASLAPFANQRVLRGVAASLFVQFPDQYGEPRNAGAVTVGVVDANGTAVASGVAATFDTTNTQYSAPLTATDLTSLGLLTATWSNGTETVDTTVEVVSGYYFSIKAARAWSRGELGDSTNYPDVLIRNAREEVEREFERVCWPFLPRYRRVQVCAGRGRIALPDMHIRSVISVAELGSDGSVDYAWTADDLAALRFDASGELTSTRGGFLGYTTYVIEYTYGFETPPGDVLDAAFKRLRYRMNNPQSGVPERAQTYTASEGGTYGLVVAGRGGSITGMPDVDVVLNSPLYRRPLIGIG